jgi:hypothetical protein
MPAYRPAPERFWEKVDRRGPDECWPWRASVGTHGYGVLGLGGHGTTTAPRFAYELLVGPIPAGLTIDHLCRNRRCVNPAHLEVVTRGENVLRGESTPARNVRKTHCKRGHEFTPENTYITPKGSRECRACIPIRKAERAVRLAKKGGGYVDLRP